MSLLLAALKKTQEQQAAPRELAELRLQEIQEAPAPQSGNVPNNSSPDHSQNITGTARAAEANLFTAKTIPPKNHLRLGIVPIALIVGVVFSVTGGVYVYRQIAPAKPALLHNATPQNMSAQFVLPALGVVSAALPHLPPAPEISPPVTTTKRASTSSIHHPAVAAKTNMTTLNVWHQPKPDAIDQMLAGAYQAYQRGDYASAAQNYRDALAQDKNNHDALLGMAAIAQQQGHDHAAMRYYRSILALDPHDLPAQAALASLAPEDAARKESRLKQLISQQPDSAALHFALGNQYAEQSRWPEAQQSYFAALATETSNALFAFNLAISLDHLGQSDAAARYYRQALQLDISGNSGFHREQAQQRLKQLTIH